MTDHLTLLRPAEKTPVQRAEAIAALLAAGLLRHLHAAHFPRPAGVTIIQEKTGEST